MKLIQKNNKNLSQLKEQDNTIPEHQLRIVERNISINTINPHDKEEELIEIIKYQTSYYTLVDS